MPPSTPLAVVAECNSAGQAGTYILSDHAFDQALERKLGRRDVRNAMSGATDATLQSNGRWLLTGGVDLDGVPVSIVVDFTRGLTVVTVF